MDTQHPAEKQFHITVNRESEAIAQVSTHGISLQLSMKGTDPTLGFTPPEALIASYGACVMRNFGKAASEFDFTIEDLRIELLAAKRNDLLGLKDVRCRITVKSDAPQEKVQAAFEKATSDGTATNAIHEGFRAQFELSRE